MRRTKYNITRLLRRGRHNDGTYKMTDALVYSYDGNNTAYHFYIKDHLGSNRVVMSENGMVEQKNYYYPFGGVYGDISTGYDVQGFKFNGKELDGRHGLTLYDYGARMYDPAIARWTSVDPLCEKYYNTSPYAYCADNPVNAVDVDGRSTWVINVGNGSYKVIGGNIYDKDRNIYVYSKDNSGNYTIRGEAIGISATFTFFYNSDIEDSNQRRSGIINPYDNSGKYFLKDMMGDDSPSLLNYIYYARNGKKYDFKVTNGTDLPIKGIDIYRGMPISDNSDGNVTFASARDIGNMTAGYIVARHGISWQLARKVFDWYQGGHEGISTVSAEMYGYAILGYHTPAQRLIRQFIRNHNRK